jgi:flagellar biosynthesis protein FliP
MRTDALAKIFGLLLALCAVSAPVRASAQEKSAGADDAEFPRRLDEDHGPATGLDALDSLPAQPPAPSGVGTPLGVGNYKIPDLTDRDNFSAALQLIVVLTVLSLAPAILIMMTCFTRIIIVLSLLRQALGTQQLPPNQVLIGLAMFMTFLVMGPTWQRVNNEALKPYLDGAIGQPEALERAKVPVREFMILQVERAGNQDDVLLFHQFAGAKKRSCTGTTSARCRSSPASCSAS